MPKNFLLSKTFWGLAAAMAGVVLDGTQFQVAPETIGAAQGWINHSLEFAGLVYAAYGRTQAKGPVTILPDG